MMIYMTPQSSAQKHLSRSRWGQIVTPQRWGNEIYYHWWCMDNGCFSGKFQVDAFFEKLEHLKPYQKTCKFIVVPDVVANAIATINLYKQWYGEFKETGYPLAFVAQDGQELLDLPPDYDCLFIGGSTEWKLSTHADKLIKQAKAAGKWVHIGRVNSIKRIRHFKLIGADSVDGTSVTFAPDKNYPLLDRGLRMQPLPLEI